MLVPFAVFDKAGNPISGAEVQLIAGKGWCNGRTVSGYTNYGGGVTLDDGCYFASTDSYTVSAAGFQSVSGTVYGLGKAAETQVSLSSIEAPGLLGCPSGFTQINGQCIQEPQAKQFTNLFNLIKANWLLIVVLVLAFAFAAMLFLNPSFFASLSGLRHSGR